MPSKKNISISGGGPAGLFAGIALLQKDPKAQITLWEQNQDNSGGFGLVIPPALASALQKKMPSVWGRMVPHFASWNQIRIFHKKQNTVYKNNPMRAIARSRLLQVLEEEFGMLGGVVVREKFNSNNNADLKIIAEGASHPAQEHEKSYSENQFTWMEADRALGAFLFASITDHAQNAIIHGYPHSKDRSSIIFESNHDFPDAKYIVEDMLNCKVLSQTSKKRFATVARDKWNESDTIFIGDAAHAMHYSIGAGTSQALKDALQLAETIYADAPPCSFQEARQADVTRKQELARLSALWFENLNTEIRFSPTTFAYRLITRTLNLKHNEVQRRDSVFARAVENGCRTWKLNENTVTTHLGDEWQVTDGPSPYPHLLTANHPDGIEDQNCMGYVFDNQEALLKWTLQHPRAERWLWLKDKVSPYNIATCDSICLRGWNVALGPDSRGNLESGLYGQRISVGVLNAGVA